MKTLGKTKLYPAAALAVLIVLIAAALFPVSSAAFAAAPLNAEIIEQNGRIFLQWDAVDGADSYEIEAVSEYGSASRQTADASPTEIGDLFTLGGEYSVTVTAFSDGEALAADTAVYGYVVTLSSPADLRYSDGALRWTAVPGATGYSVTVNGIPLGSTAADETEFDLSGILAVTGEYTAAVTTLGDGAFNLDSPAAELSFAFSAPPLSPYDIALGKSGESYIASWPPMTDESPEGYVYKVETDGERLFCGITEENHADVTAYVAEDGVYVLSVACVRDGIRGAFFSRSFTVTGGEIVL